MSKSRTLTLINSIRGTKLKKVSGRELDKVEEAKKVHKRGQKEWLGVLFILRKLLFMPKRRSGRKRKRSEAESRRE
jgi:hypothetical protein